MLARAWILVGLLVILIFSDYYYYSFYFLSLSFISDMWYGEKFSSQDSNVSKFSVPDYFKERYSLKRSEDDLAEICRNYYPRDCPVSVEYFGGLSLFYFDNVAFGFRHQAYHINDLAKYMLLYSVATSATTLTNVTNIGGGMGYFSVLLKKYFPSFCVQSLNPHPTHRYIFNKNVELNNLSAASLPQLEVALAPKDSMKFQITDESIFSPLEPIESSRGNSDGVEELIIPSISPKVLLEKFKTDVLVVDAPGAEDHMCMYLSRVEKATTSSRPPSPTIWFIVTYSKQSHIRCLVAAAAHHLSILEDSPSLQPKMSSKSLLRAHSRRRFASSYYGLVAAFPVGSGDSSRPRPSRQESLRLRLYKAPEHMRALLAEGASAPLVVSPISRHGDFLALHSFPYGFSTNRNSSDYLVVAQLLSQRRQGGTLPVK